MFLFKLQTVFVTIAKCTLCSEGGSYLLLVAAALASLVEERGGTGGAGSDMEMICHSGAEIISDIGQIRKISGGNPKKLRKKFNNFRKIFKQLYEIWR